jgi:chemotaxis protein MotB
LVITFLAEVLFDSGKAKLKPESLPILDKVAGIINEEAPENNIGIEGHTDNVPIKHSSWKSNWELSSHRALSVLYYLESKGVQSEKLSASGYGEYKPVSSNDSSEGRQMNRRVEIVIMPKTSKKAGKEVSQMKGTKADEEELK